jgi:hypothetical protein
LGNNIFGINLRFGINFRNGTAPWDKRVIYLVRGQHGMLEAGLSHHPSSPRQIRTKFGGGVGSMLGAMSEK